MALLEVRNLAVAFQTRQGCVRAVDGIDLCLEAGQTLGLVGESGSGKSVTNLAILGLVPRPPGVTTGSVLFEGQELLGRSDRDLRAIRGNRIAMIFQDPMTSLNPLLTIGRQLTEVLEVHKGLLAREARRRSAAALAEVGIAEPERRLDQYPHQLSGGMRQRVMIAMGLICEPALLLADEPTTALDVTIQAQILELMKALQERRGTAIILVTHDLGVVAGMAAEVAVMYAGRLVETGKTKDIFRAPSHPYTRGLLRSIPRLSGSGTQPLRSIPGTPPDLSALPLGCAFEPRCPDRRQSCTLDRPPLASAGLGRRCACPVTLEEVRP